MSTIKDAVLRAKEITDDFDCTCDEEFDGQLCQNCKDKNLMNRAVEEINNTPFDLKKT